MLTNTCFFRVSLRETNIQNMEHGTVRELASLSLNIQSKKFYLDVKENQSGRFVKIAEASFISFKIIFFLENQHLKRSVPQ